MKRTRFSIVPLATVQALQDAIAAGNAAHATFAAQILALQNAVAAISPGITTVALAEGTTTAVLLNASVDVVLTLSHTMADTSYTVELPTLGTATFVEKTAARTRTSITVTMKAVGLSITAGQPLVAAAWK